jgi:hypothetical protein
VAATVAGFCVLVGLSRIPFLRAPVSPDEGGFLVVASQWHAGSSLYGGYWVDRPPMLIAIFAAADALGGTVGLRLIGTLAVISAIVAGAGVGWHASGRRPVGALAAAGVVAAFLATPLFGTRIVDGELLASPLVLGGLASLLASYGGSGRMRSALLRILAGACAAGAFLTKQDMVDVMIVVIVVVTHTLWRRGPRAAAEELLPTLAGAVAAASAIVTLAVLRGTSLPGLWQAVVVFRFRAAGVVSYSRPRLDELGHAYVVTGALPLTVVAGLVSLWCWWRARGETPPTQPWRTGAVALMGWEVAGVLAGGSYWSHYLVGLVPGLSLLVAVALREPRRVSRLLAVGLLYAGVSTAVSCWGHDTTPTSPSADQAAASYVRSQARPGDSIVVAFGHADIVRDTGLPSPYPYLWALPAFVDDPRMTGLDRLLRSPEAPRWFVASSDLSRWEPPGAKVQSTADRCYTVADRTGRWLVMRRRQAATPAPPPGHRRPCSRG